MAVKNARPEATPKPPQTDPAQGEDTAHPELSAKESRQSEVIFDTRFGLRLFLIGAAVAIAAYVAVVLFIA